jgi:hypothetical protein
MDPISRLSKALSGLRKGSPAKSERKATTTSGRGSSASSARDNSSNTDLRTDIAQRIAQIDVTQPDQRAAAVRVFIEQVLSREFGHAAIASAAFQQRIGDVQRVMDSDALLEDLASQKDTKQR